VAHLGLERQGRRVVTKASPDGKSWETLLDEQCPGHVRLVLPKRLRIGVFAADGAKAVFDEFSLAVGSGKGN
jgi:hypothetical protein